MCVSLAWDSHLVVKPDFRVRAVDQSGGTGDG